MTAPTATVVRALTESDAFLFHTLPDPGLVGRTLVGRTYATRRQGGEYRPDWTWVALREGRVVARAAWWGAPGDQEPHALDWFDFADGEAATATELLRTAPLYAEYDLLVPPGWRDLPAVRAAAQARIDAAEAAGMKLLVERFRYEWTVGHGLPDRPGRLDFRPEPDDEVVLDVLRRVGHGSLDAHTRHTAHEHGEEAAAREELDLLSRLPSPRSWWRLAHTPDGRVAGIQVPALNSAGACVGFIGVLPEHRGNGYAYELLAECTHQLAAEGATTIAAATDQHNHPMVAAFARAGYPVVQERINLV
ncbi:GNAT family N-acetyltransferase [Streptomyces meridianus]|uniref:GNAT family N-acetyltransferase n=1 Tax=Streptomyces meridianus TaxID=2938945 RepID=A0ABT0X306_9ACTN|nr:GNAT family N-acetyltransferase [Streptomyces meridianus]MCM2576925.1 GNAT family N-acetyltransferase [Streptomyces meridianus]